MNKERKMEKMFNKINNQLETLQGMINEKDFINLFLSKDINFNYVYKLTNDITVTTVYYGIPYLLQQNKDGVDMFITLLQLLYNMFKQAIPYNQHTSAVTSYDIVTNAATDIEAPMELIGSIVGYIQAYLPEIYKWWYAKQRIELALKQVTSGATRTVSKNVTNESLNQNQNINKSSFNPVETQGTVTVNKVNVNKQSNGGLQTEQVTMSDAANFDINSSGNSSQSNLTSGTKELDLTQLRELGNEKPIKYLKGFIYKIATLFWALGNDYYNNNAVEGFHIW